MIYVQTKIVLLFTVCFVDISIMKVLIALMVTNVHGLTILFPAPWFQLLMCHFNRKENDNLSAPL